MAQENFTDGHFQVPRRQCGEHGEVKLKNRRAEPKIRAAHDGKPSAVFRKVLQAFETLLFSAKIQHVRTMHLAKKEKKNHLPPLITDNRDL